MRQTLSDERWDMARPQLLDLMLAADKIPDAYSKCSHCKNKQTAIRCRDCLPKQLFCSECDVNIHRHLPLHNRDSLLQGFYKPIPPTCYAAVNDDGAVSLCEQGMYEIVLNFKCMFYALLCVYFIIYFCWGDALYSHPCVVKFLSYLFVACLLPVAWPSTICSCSEEFTVGIGRPIILVTIDGKKAIFEA